MSDTNKIKYGIRNATIFPATIAVDGSATYGEAISVPGSVSLSLDQQGETNIFYATPRYEGFTEYPLTLGQGECFVLADRRIRGQALQRRQPHGRGAGLPAEARPKDEGPAV